MFQPLHQWHLYSHRAFRDDRHVKLTQRRPPKTDGKDVFSIAGECRMDIFINADGSVFMAEIQVPVQPSPLTVARLGWLTSGSGIRLESLLLPGVITYDWGEWSYLEDGLDESDRQEWGLPESASVSGEISLHDCPQPEMALPKVGTSRRRDHTMTDDNTTITIELSDAEANRTAIILRKWVRDASPELNPSPAFVREIESLAQHFADTLAEQRFARLGIPDPIA